MCLRGLHQRPPKALFVTFQSRHLPASFCVSAVPGIPTSGFLEGRAFDGFSHFWFFRGGDLFFRAMPKNVPKDGKEKRRSGGVSQPPQSCRWRPSGVWFLEVTGCCDVNKVFAKQRKERRGGKKQRLNWGSCDAYCTVVSGCVMVQV